MNSDPQPRWIFEMTPSGLALPRALSVPGLGTSAVAWGPSVMQKAARSGLRACPTYEDVWDGQREEWSTLVGRVPLRSWLEFLPRLSGVVLHEGASQAERNDQLLSAFSAASRNRVIAFRDKVELAEVLSAFAVLLTIERVLASCPSRNGPASLDDDSRDVMLKGVLSTWSDLGSTGEEVHENPAGIAAAMRERSSFTPPLNMLVRAYGLWCWEHAQISSTTRDERAHVDSSLHATYGLSLVDWMNGVACAVLVMHSRSLADIVKWGADLQLPIPDVTPPGNELLRRVLRNVSASVACLSGACRDAFVPESRSKPVLLPLKRFPVLRMARYKQRFRVLSTVHLAEAALERPRRIREVDTSHPRGAARTAFGCVLEDYVHGLLAQVFPRYQRLDAASPRAAAGKRADGVLWFDDGFIVIECKGRQSPEAVRYAYRSDEEYVHELKQSGLASAVQQIRQTTEDILRGSIPLRCRPVPLVAASLIVMWQDVPQSEAFGDAIDRVLGATELLPGVTRLKAQVVSVAEIESIDQWSHVCLLTALRRKMTQADASREPLDNYLRTVATPRDVRVLNTIFDALRQDLKPLRRIPPSQ